MLDTQIVTPKSSNKKITNKQTIVWVSPKKKKSAIDHIIQFEAVFIDGPKGELAIRLALSLCELSQAAPCFFLFPFFGSHFCFHIMFH